MQNANEASFTWQPPEARLTDRIHTDWTGILTETGHWVTVLLGMGTTRVWCKQSKLCRGLCLKSSSRLGYSSYCNIFDIIIHHTPSSYMEVVNQAR